MKHDIADDKKFAGILEHGRFYDCETPYGYGGPLCDTVISDESQKSFLHEICDYSRSEGIVSQFVRFHPLLENHSFAPLAFETRYLHDTIYIDTTSPELVMKNMDCKNRNMVRKAIKNDVSIEIRTIADYAPFVSLYKETMIRAKADDYYFFDESYFKAQQLLKENACIFYAIKDSRPIAGAIIYYNENFMHYHLAGTNTEFRKFSPSNLLLYEAACWGSTKGIKKFYLGGGITQDDNLFGFKKQFNKNGKLPFFIGRIIFDHEKYDYLLHVREKINPDFDKNNNRMIQYRY